jgi:hypothetical protein
VTQEGLTAHGVPQLRRELGAVEAEITKAERTLQRYVAAFGDATLLATRLAQRMAELEGRDPPERLVNLLLTAAPLRPVGAAGPCGPVGAAPPAAAG